MVDGLNPDFASRLEAFQGVLRDRYGLDTSVGSGLRDNDTQSRLYAQGRTAPGPIVTNAPPGSSYHNYGAAADLVPRGMSEKDATRILGRAFAENPDTGLTWGGNFKSISDPFHVQLNVPLDQLRGQQGPSNPAPPVQSAPVPSSSSGPIQSAGAATAPAAPPNLGMLAGADLQQQQSPQPNYGMLAQQALAAMQPKPLQAPPLAPINYPMTGAMRARLASAALNRTG